MTVRALISLLFGVATAGLVAALGYLVAAVYAQEEMLSLSETANRISSEIEFEVNSGLSTTQILKAQVVRDGGNIEDFEEVAASTISSLGGVSNLQLAPGGIVRQIYPLEGNEKAIGHDTLRDDARRADARRAVESGELTVAGPFELVQGGIALVGRNPVFLEDGGSREFWGFASGLIFVDDLLGRTSLSELDDRGISYQITRNPSVPEDLETVGAVGDPVGVSHASSIQIPAGEWTLTLYDRQTPLFARWWPWAFASIALGGLAALLTNSVLAQPQRLRVRVMERTRELDREANTDPVTGLPNRRRFLTELGKRVRAGEQTGLFLLDLDDFKAVNDTLGHQQGDALLRVLSARLARASRSSDMVARLGGDEFALLVDNVGDPSEGTRIAQRVAEAIDEPLRLGEAELAVHASIGQCLIPTDATSVDEAMKRADVALYEAKRLGKGCAVSFTAKLEERAARSAEIGRRFLPALHRGEISLMYQPIFAFDRREPLAFEALARWTSPSLGSVPPTEFIAVAEESGSIIEFGEWSLGRVCDMLIKLRGLGIDSPVAMNLSRRQLQDPELSARILDALRAEDLASDRLILEVTETAVLADPKQSSLTLASLREEGVQIAIDDFGTGQSSLSTLTEIDVDLLKLDKHFLQNLDQPHGHHLVSGIVTLGHSLGLRVIAEGIEDPAQLGLMRELKLDAVQGFLLAQPTTAGNTPAAAASGSRKLSELLGDLGFCESS